MESSFISHICVNFIGNTKITKALCDCITKMGLLDSNLFTLFNFSERFDKHMNILVVDDINSDLSDIDYDLVIAVTEYVDAGELRNIYKGDVNILQVCLCTLMLCAYGPDLPCSEIDEDNFNSFGLEQFGKIVWCKLTHDEKITNVKKFILETRHEMLNESGLSTLVDLLVTGYSKLIYKLNAQYNEYCNGAISDIECVSIDAITYLNNLIEYCKRKYDYDVTRDESYWRTPTDLHAVTGIKCIDAFSKLMTEMKTTDSVDEIMCGPITNDCVMDILNYINETMCINKLFYNTITASDYTNIIYGKFITARNSAVMNRLEYTDGKELNQLLAKTPSNLLPCIGNITDDKKLLALFCTVDYKYLKLNTVENMLDQLVRIINEIYQCNSKQVNDKFISYETLHTIMYHLEKIKLVTFHIYSVYKKLERLICRDEPTCDFIKENVIYENLLINNIEKLVYDIDSCKFINVLKTINAEIFTVKNTTPIDVKSKTNGVGKKKVVKKNTKKVTDDSSSVDDNDSTKETTDLENETEVKYESDVEDEKNNKSKKATNVNLRNGKLSKKI